MSLTKTVKVNPLNPEEKTLKEAAAILRDGGLVIIPTETVYGIAANMLDNYSIDRLYEIKKRPVDKPFSLHLARKSDVEKFAADIPVSAYKLMDKFWPGPLTLIFKARDKKGNIGMRMPDDPVALRVIELSGVPLVCPSANISGKPAPVDFSAAIKDLDGLVDLALDAGKTRLSVESTVVDLTLEPLKVLREGVIRKEEILQAVRKKNVLFICTGNSCRSVMAEALLKKKLRENDRDDVEVLSAGIMLMEGLGASEATIEILQREGIDIFGHRSQPVTKELLKKSDIILLMERLHEDRIMQLAPEVKNRVFLLKEFAKINDTELNIADPIGKPLEFYEKTLEVIKDAVERISKII